MNERALPGRVMPSKVEDGKTGWRVVMVAQPRRSRQPGGGHEKSCRGATRHAPVASARAATHHSERHVTAN